MMSMSLSSIGWFSVYGHVLATTALLWVLADVARFRRRGGAIPGRVLLRWSVLLVASAMAFAGLFKMVRKGIIKPDDVVVVNCSGHTFPVEEHVLDEGWARSLDLDEDLSLTVQAPAFPSP